LGHAAAEDRLKEKSSLLEACTDNRAALRGRKFVPIGVGVETGDLSILATVE